MQSATTNSDLIHKPVFQVTNYFIQRLRVWIKSKNIQCIRNLALINENVVTCNSDPMENIRGNNGASSLLIDEAANESCNVRMLHVHDLLILLNRYM